MDVRRYFPQHALPSEAAELLDTVIGAKPLRVLAGSLRESDLGDTPDVRYRAATYIQFDNHCALEFRLDDLVSSLGIRLITEVPSREDLLEKIARLDLLLPDLARSQWVGEEPEVSLGNRRITSTKRYKLPDNHGILHARDLHKNEQIVSFQLTQGEDLLVACRVTRDSCYGPQVIRWEDIPETFPRELLEEI